MEELEIEVFKKDGAKIPIYATEGASGMDLFANLEDPLEVKPFERKLIPTGIYISIPYGYEAEIRPRSGLALEYGITVLNSPGTIDGDYRGEIKVILINLGDKTFTVKNGDRIAQMVFKRIVKARLKSVQSLSETKRGRKGFGSTGI